jgi:UPF0271 protein
MSTIDLNADVGEAFGLWPMGDDEALLDVVTSANIACGMHAGDPSHMRRTCELAVAKQVTIGAHVGYRDLAGFGRRFIDMEFGNLRDDVLYQLGALDAFARAAGGAVRYVKPHGALYNALMANRDQAAAVVAAVRDFGGRLGVLGLPGSALLRAASDGGLPTFEEAFADRAYTTSGELVSRRLPGAVIHDPAVSARRCVRLVRDGVIDTVEDIDLPLRADSVCVHGDTAGAVEIAQRIKEALLESNVSIKSFVA